MDFVFIYLFSVIFVNFLFSFYLFDRFLYQCSMSITRNISHYLCVYANWPMVFSTFVGFPLSFFFHTIIKKKKKIPINVLPRYNYCKSTIYQRSASQLASVCMLNFLYTLQTLDQSLPLFSLSISHLCIRSLPYPFSTLRRLMSPIPSSPSACTKLRLNR